MRLDIVMPAHNEQDRIDRTLRAYRRACAGTDFRFLVALDSCTDATETVVAEHAQSDPRVLALEYPKLGKGGVIAETFARSDAELVGFVDADCATPPRELLRLADAARARRRRDRVAPPPRRAAAGAPRRSAREITSAGLRRQRADADGAAVPRHAVRREGAAPRRGPTTCCRGSPRATCCSTSTCSPPRATRGWRVVEVPTVWIDQEGSRVERGRRLAPDGRPRCCGCGCAAACARARSHDGRPVPRLTSPSSARSPRLGERHGGWTGVASYSANLADALDRRGRAA